MTMNIFNSWVEFPMYGWWNNSGNSSIISGANSKLSTSGPLWFPDGSSSKLLGTNSKVIWRWNAASTTISSSTVRLGIQDISGTPVNGMPVADGTFDVYLDLVSQSVGDNTIVYSFTNTAAGDKTMNQGTIYSCVADFTSYGGSDAMRLNANRFFNYAGGRVQTNPGVVWMNEHNGTAWQLTSTGNKYGGNCCLVFEDGEIGFLGPPIAQSTATFNNDSADDPDTWINVFVPPCDMLVAGMSIQGGDVDLTNTLDFFIQSDPLGSPSTLVTKAFDQDLMYGANTNDAHSVIFNEPVTLRRGVTYGYGVEVTSATANFDLEAVYEYSTDAGVDIMSKVFDGMRAYEGKDKASYAAQNFGADSDAGVWMMVLYVMGVEDGAGYAPTLALGV